MPMPRTASTEEGAEVEGAEVEGAEDEVLEATCPPAEVSEDEVLEWKVVKTQCRDAWHDLRDEKQAEWLEAKAAFNETAAMMTTTPSSLMRPARVRARPMSR